MILASLPMIPALANDPGFIHIYNLLLLVKEWQGTSSWKTSDHCFGGAFCWRSLHRDTFIWYLLCYTVHLCIHACLWHEWRWRFCTLGTCPALAEVPLCCVLFWKVLIKYIFLGADKIYRTKSTKAAGKFLSQAPEFHDVNKLFKNGNTFLHYVAAKCSFQSILQFLQKGADITLENSFHKLPVEFAIQEQNGKWDNEILDMTWEWCEITHHFFRR